MQEKINELLLNSGSLSKDEVDAILNSLPVELTFIDKDDVTKYFNNPAKRLFPRNENILGTDVRNCHSSSMKKLNQMIEDFRSGKENLAVSYFWKEGKLINISYMAVKNEAGEYMGILEVAQDVTRFNQIKDEQPESQYIKL